MSKLNRQIEAARQALLDAESRLEDLEDKKRRYNRKRDRKRWRKAYRTNPTIRIAHRISREIFKATEEPFEFKGISQTLLEATDGDV